MENSFAILDDEYDTSKNIINLIEVKEDIAKSKNSPNNLNPTYEEKIKIIQEYFGVSEICAIYLYHRRRRGVPWHKPNDKKYLEWSIQLQNAIIYLDTIVGFDWHSLEFGFEEIQFTKHGIDLNKIDKKIMVLSETSDIFLMNNPDKDGFIKVSKNKINITKQLNKMGLLPRSYCK
jgi:hypothetical protein